MKFLMFIFLLLIPVIAIAQVDRNISVISIEKASVVYRGIDNHVKIAVPGAKSFIPVTEHGNLKKIDSLGNYYWNVTSAAGTKGIIKIDAVMLDGSTKHEEKIFQIKGIPPIMAYINGDYEDRVYNMTRQQIKDLQVDITINNLYFEVEKVDVIDFVIRVADSTYYNKGNKIETKFHDIINELQNGSEIILGGIIFWKDGDGPRVQGIKIRVEDDPLPDNYIPKPILSVEKANIIYRGIDNPIKIIVPGAKSFKVTASGNLRKIDNDGNYLYNVTSVSGTKAIVKFEITTARDSIVYETKEYFINQMKDGKTTINGKNNIECNLELTKKELIESTVGIKIDDFYIDNGVRNVVSFEIYLPGANGRIVSGDKMDVNVINKIKTLLKDSEITIIAYSEHSRIIPAIITLTD